MDEEKNTSLSDDIQSGVNKTLHNIKDIAKIGAKAAAGNYVGAAIDAARNGTIRRTLIYIIAGCAGIFLAFSMLFLMIPTLMFGSVDENGEIVYVTDQGIQDYEGKFAISQMSYFINATKEMSHLTENAFNSKLEEVENEIRNDFGTRKYQYTAPADEINYRLYIKDPNITPEYFYCIPSMYCVRQEDEASSDLGNSMAYSPDKTLSEEDASDLTCLGNFKLTFYCPCSTCCGSFSNGITATGTTATQGRTIAVDSKKIPLGTQVYIDGYGWFTAEDTGGAIKGNRIDIFMTSHQAALNAGVQYANVYVNKADAEKISSEKGGIINSALDLIGAAWSTVTDHWSMFVKSLVGAIFPDYETNIRNDKYLYELEYFMQLAKAEAYNIDQKIAIEKDEQIITWRFIDANIGPIITHTRPDGTTYTSCTITLTYKVDLKSLDYIATKLYRLNRGRENVGETDINFCTYQTERAMQMGKNIMELIGIHEVGGATGVSMMTPEEIANILNSMNLTVTNDTRRRIIASAVTLIGKTTYNLGSKASPSVDYPIELDCSGFVTWAYGRAGIEFVHGSANQYYNSKRITASELKPGDLGLLTEPNNIATGDYNHVGIYIGTDNAGNRVFIHCSGGHNGVYMEAYPNFKVFVRPDVLSGAS